jgi:hypothetical protein
MRIDGPSGATIEVTMVTADGEVTEDPERMAWAEATWHDEHGRAVRRDYLVADRPVPSLFDS